VVSRTVEPASPADVESSGSDEAGYWQTEVELSVRGHYSVMRSSDRGSDRYWTVGQLPLGPRLRSRLVVGWRRLAMGPDTIASILVWGWRRSCRASLHTRADSRSSACRCAVYFCASYIFIM